MLKFLVNSSKRYKGVNTENWSEAVFCKLCWYRCSDFILKLYLNNTAWQFKQEIGCIFIALKVHRYCFCESGHAIIIKIPKTITILIIIMLRRQGRFVYVPNVFSVFGAGIYSIYGLLCGCFFDMGESLPIFELLSPFFLCLPFINVPDLISLFSLSLNGWNDRDRKYYSAKHVLESFDIAT